jgi:CRP/FNR family transcriptional regulator, cyclic AMP receptor protein
MNIFFDSPARSGSSAVGAASTAVPLARDLDAWVRLSNAHNAEDSFRPRLSAEQWTMLAAYMSKASLRPGETLLNQGDTDRSLYFLLDGTLQVFVTPTGPGGSGKLVHLREGTLLGEAGLFGPAPRLANVEALNACSVLVLRAQRLEELSLRSPAVALEVFKAAAAVLLARSRSVTGKCTGVI